MNIRIALIIGLIIICLSSAGIGVWMMNSPAVAAPSDTVNVVVSNAVISRGQIVSAGSITTRAWPRGFVPPNAIGDPTKVIGRTALHHILAGEVVIEGKLAEKDAGRGLASLIPEGRRAYAIQTSHVASNVAGFVLPGNRVDVLLTLRGGPRDSTGGGSSTTLLQAVEILAVNDRLDGPDDQKAAPQNRRSVTLLVTPDQASLLDLGQHMGTLTLSLRNPEDIAEADTNPATLDVLRFTQREPVVDEPADSVEHSWLTKSLDSAVTAAALALPKAATLGAVAANETVEPSSPPKTQKKRYTQIRTLRGRQSGSVYVRSDR